MEFSNVKQHNYKRRGMDWEKKVMFQNQCTLDVAIDNIQIADRSIVSETTHPRDYSPHNAIDPRELNLQISRLNPW
jgi:hypothetical protein